MALTLSEVRGEWLVAAMEVVYTGKAALAGPEEMERVAEVMAMLGINIRREQMSLENRKDAKTQVEMARDMDESSDTPTWASAVIKEGLKRTGGATKFLPFEEEQGKLFCKHNTVITTKLL